VNGAFMMITRPQRLLGNKHPGGIYLVYDKQRSPRSNKQSI